MWVRTALLAAAIAGLAACTSGGSAAGPSEPPPVASLSSAGTSDPTLVSLTKGDACGDAFFWASTTSGDTAVVVTLEGTNTRSKIVSTTYPLSEEDLWQVSVLQGKHLDRNFCTDLIVTNWEPTSRQEVIAGTGEIVLTPRTVVGQNCGTVQGSLNLEGLVAEDGTRFAPISVESPNLGCVQG